MELILAEVEDIVADVVCGRKIEPHEGKFAGADFNESQLLVVSQAVRRRP